jgi:UDP-N-acetylglucosamine--N-acetylmuramyl-(pentapeptide) pyrophosphoryl-undecaprenol N-acetylglucosamine transferase
LFKIPLGVIESFWAILWFRPSAVFCKGGYVSFPVAIGGWLARRPVFLHESDVVPGLANRMTAFFASKVLVSFEESSKYFKKDKVVVTGNPVRSEIYRGSVDNGLRFLKWSENDKPVILVMGGSQGALTVNELVWKSLKKLTKKYRIVHICGKGNTDRAKRIVGSNKFIAGRYRYFEYVNAEMKDLYAVCDLIVSRAGAISLAEISAVGKPAVLIPLGKKYSRGDQIDNALAFSKHHKAIVLNEDDLSLSEFLLAVDSLAKGASSSVVAFNDFRRAVKKEAVILGAGRFCDQGARATAKIISLLVKS